MVQYWLMMSVLGCGDEDPIRRFGLSADADPDGVDADADLGAGPKPTSAANGTDAGPDTPAGTDAAGTAANTGADDDNGAPTDTGPPEFVWPEDLTLRVCADGTETYTDIQAAVDVSVPGDVIGVCPGTYGRVFVGWLKDVKVVGPGRELATISGGDNGAVYVTDGRLELSGFTVTGHGWVHPDETDIGGAFTVAEGKLLVRDVLVTGVTGAYAVVFDEDLLTMEDVTWEGNTSTMLWFLYQGDLATIRRNWVHGGVHEHLLLTERLHVLDLGDSVFDDVDIDSGFAAFQLVTDGDGPFVLHDNVFHDIDDHSPWGGRTFHFEDDIPVEFRSNLVVGCDARDPHEIEASYSLFHDNGVDYQQVVEGVGNLFGIDPRFVDRDRSDFRLAPGSPAVDAGSQLEPDPDGTPNDIGPYWPR